MRVRETGTNLAGSASATSDATGPVSDIPLPPPPPPPSSSCSRDDATGCAATAGSRVSLLNQKFTCNRPLGDIAAQNPIGAGPGHLPLLVEVDFTTYVDLNPAVVDLRQDCVGDGDDETIDLILAIEGDGRTRRRDNGDAIKVRLTASDIQLTGYANCGPRGLGSDGLPGDSRTTATRTAPRSRAATRSSSSTSSGATGRPARRRARAPRAPSSPAA